VPQNISGARYSIVQALIVYFLYGVPNYLAKPKSAIFIIPYRLTKIFYGFKSLINS